MSRLIQILRTEQPSLSLERVKRYRESLKGLNPSDLEITDEVLRVLAGEIAPLQGSPEGEFYRFCDILGLAKPILEQASLVEIPQGRRESVRRLLFGSVLEQQGIDRREFYADVQRAYGSYCGRVESLKALQKQVAPEFDKFGMLYQMNLMEYPTFNLTRAEEESRL